MVVNYEGNIIEPKIEQSAMVKDAAILSWNTDDISGNEIKRRTEDWEECYPDTSECPSEDEIQKDVGSDSDFFAWEYECMVDRLTKLMEAVNPNSNLWKARVHNFGWRNQDGTAEVNANNGLEFLRKLLPACDCTYYIHLYEEDGRVGIAIQNSHHDSPTGNEWYYIFPVN